jgi:hypothetical protein
VSERKDDQNEDGDGKDRPVRAGASEVEEKGAHQDGGTKFDETGRVIGYTHEGAVSATPGGPIDPTIRPSEGQGGDFDEAVDREDAGPTTRGGSRHRAQPDR